MQSVRNCEKLSNELVTGQKKLAASTSDELRTFGLNVKREDDHREQVVNLREDKATLKERITSSVNDLSWHRHELTTLRDKERKNYQDIAELKAALDSARNQPRDSLQTETRLQELKGDKRDLQKRLDSSQHEAQTYATRAQQKSAEVEHLQNLLSEAQLHAENTKAQHESTESASSERYKQDLEDRLEAQREKLTELALRRESSIRSEYANNEMRTKKENDDKCKQLEYQMKKTERLLQIANKKSEEERTSSDQGREVEDTLRDQLGRLVG